MTAVQAPVRRPGSGLPEGLAQDLAAASLALARRMSAGATLWCAAPSWPHHAQHVAVEFVHPVVVGKPALPAVALTAPDLLGQARAHLSSGDVLLLVAGADQPVARELVRRAPAWGVGTLWVGDGPRPAPGAADHVLWLPDEDRAAHDGRFMLLYHLLWELTHVCLEHGGLLGAASPDQDEACITCSDEGRLGEVASVRGSTAQVRTARGVEEVDTTLVPPLQLDDLVLVHAGTAITRLEPS